MVSPLQWSIAAVFKENQEKSTYHVIVTLFIMMCTEIMIELMNKIKEHLFDLPNFREKRHSVVEQGLLISSKP